jgi:hypothetical protein
MGIRRVTLMGANSLVFRGDASPAVECDKVDGRWPHVWMSCGPIERGEDIHALVLEEFGGPSGSFFRTQCCGGVIGECRHE